MDRAAWVRVGGHAYLMPELTFCRSWSIVAAVLAAIRNRSPQHRAVRGQDAGLHAIATVIPAAADSEDSFVFASAELVRDSAPSEIDRTVGQGQLSR
jgi:hypothetical protein